jgi:ABC-type transport system involved in resistance to organic solvents, auxiliary component
MPIARALRSLLTAGLGLLAFTTAPVLHAAATNEAKAAVAAGIEEVSAAIRERPHQEDLIALLDTLVDKHFAFTTTTRLAVGPAWRDFSPEQRTRTTALFSRLVIRTYADRVTGDTQPKIVYGQPLEMKAGRVEVPTTTTAAGQTYAVTYRLELDRTTDPARWRVYDVVAEGVSLISNYRSQFEPILRKSGAPGLIEALEAKVAEQNAALASAKK